MDDEFNPVFDDDGNELASRFAVEPDATRPDRQCLLIFQSSGGTYNRAYNKALNLVLQRLVPLRAVLERVEVVSTVAMKLDREQRVVHIDGYELPIALNREVDSERLRQKIGTGVSKTARTKANKKQSKGGNPQKKVCLVLSFTEGQVPDVPAIIREVERGDQHGYQYSPQSSAGIFVSHDAEGPKTDSKSRHTSKTNPSGAGRQQDQAVKEAVEQYAMQVAMDYYEKAKLTPERCDGPNNPYDIKCTFDGRTIYVEVKGSTVSGAVNLTRNEVNHANANPADFVLFIVANIKVDHSKSPPVCSEGEAMIYEGWHSKGPHSGTLEPIAYTYRPPRKPTKRYRV